MDGGYQRQIDFATWIENRRDKFDGGNVPTLNSIVFVKSILDVLVEAEKPLTEKTIKTLCAKYCKDAGVRVTMKGGVAGQSLDVNIVCGVLEALGLVEVKIQKFTKSELEAENSVPDFTGKNSTDASKFDMGGYNSRNYDVSLCKAIVDKWDWLLTAYLTDLQNKKASSTGKSVGRPRKKR